MVAAAADDKGNGIATSEKEDESATAALGKEVTLITLPKLDIRTIEIQRGTWSASVTWLKKKTKLPKR